MERDRVPWYWRLLATVSTLMILGGFLMLPATFEDDPKLKISTTALGIFGLAIVVVGFACTGLLAYTVRNPLFQGESIFQPALTACAVALLTVLYDFIISSRYVWNIKSLLVVTAASLSLVVYMGLLIWTYRRIGHVKARVPLSMQAEPMQSGLLQAEPPRNESFAPGNSSNFYQEPGYYQNYIQNMFPASVYRPPMPNQQTSYQGYNQSGITEEEMQRQQMLMLLLKQEQPVTPEQTSATYRLEWQSADQDQDDVPPHQGYYAPQQGSSAGAGYPMADLSRRFTRHELEQPWDGVWRSPIPAPGQASGEARNNRLSQDQRNQRRQDIEMGR